VTRRCSSTLVGDANDTTGRTWSSVTRLLRLLVAAPAEVIGAAMDDDGALYPCQIGSLHHSFTLGRQSKIQRQTKSKRKTYTNDAVRADQLDQPIGNAALGIPLAVRHTVTQVTDMALVVFGGTVGFVVGVDCAVPPPPVSLCQLPTFSRPSTLLTVRSGARAAVGVVTKGVDVHAALGVRIVAGNAPCNLGGGALVGLLKSHGALDVGVATQNGN